MLVPGEFQHGVFPYTDTCVDTNVVRYLLGETPDQRDTSCQAHPLKQDAASAPLPAQPKVTLRSAGAENLGAGAVPPTYLDSEKAQKLIERFKEGIGRRR